MNTNRLIVSSGQQASWISFLSLGIFLLATGWLQGQTSFQIPPKPILDLADTKAPTGNLISPDNHFLVQVERPLYKSLDELAEPEVKLAGLRFNPVNFNMSRGGYYTSLKLLRLPMATEVPLQGMPSDGRIQYLSFSPSESHVAFVLTRSGDLELWLLDLQTGKASFTGHRKLNAVMGMPYLWESDGKSLIFKSRGEKTTLPAKQELPKGPATQDATGEKAPARTYQDLLRNREDEQRFDHYAQSTLYRVLLSQPEKAIELGMSGIFKNIQPSPNGEYLLAETVVQPYSYTLPFGFFSSQVALHGKDGKKQTVFYNRPLQDKIPPDFDAVESGKRNISWRNDEGATLMWLEAPDGGDPRKPSEFRDQIFQANPPFSAPQSLGRFKNRVSNVILGTSKLAIVQDEWWKNRNTRTYLIDPSKDNPNPRILFDRSSEDAYGDPGSFVLHSNAMKQDVLWMSTDGKKLYLEGEGCSPEGNRPFLDEFDIASGKARRLWRAEGKSTYEAIVRVLDPEKKQILTSIQEPKVMPNLFLREFGKKPVLRQLTFRPNPYASLSGVKKEKIFYKRKDGVQLSATLYLPAGYDKNKDGRLPMLMEAYPTEYKDEKNAGQLKESPFTFIAINWASPVFWVNRGFAILEDAQFPIIGKGQEEPNDTYIEQLVADAEAAIRYVDSIGVVDKNRCAAMGHSYGAFMTANLLCHSNLFAAGIARSGAYNRTLTPFGFQAEERTYWQAPQVYNRMSPFTYADKFSNPLLMIHGDADNNPGTFTLQSERLFQAIKGNGGKARLVLLPFESHGYAARENILHMLWEMDTWLDKWVKNKK
jgi:dipeptidyl aminopeptidase/acylaminoacyl peptidase